MATGAAGEHVPWPGGVPRGFQRIQKMLGKCWENAEKMLKMKHVGDTAKSVERNWRNGGPNESLPPGVPWRSLKACEWGCTPQHASLGGEWWRGRGVVEGRDKSLFIFMIPS